MTIEHAGLVGGGLMGSGIAQCFAAAGIRTTVVDIDETATTRCTERVRADLARQLKREEISEEDADIIGSRIETTTTMSQLADCDLVVEAVPEAFELKYETFGELDSLCPPTTVLATNTSQFSISAIAAATSTPGRVIGMHWFYPPTRMNLIEVIRGIETSDSALDLVIEVAHLVGKETVICERDTQGFITTRLILLLGLEATRIVEEGIASVEDVNTACRLAFGHAMGPLDTLDLSGLDTTLEAAEAMAHSYGDRYRAPQLLRGLVAAGHHGRKSGQGFRNYR